MHYLFFNTLEAPNDNTNSDTGSSGSRDSDHIMYANTSSKQKAAAATDADAWSLNPVKR